MSHALFLLLLFEAFVQVAAPGNTVSRSTLGSVSGRVLDADSGLPLKGVRVGTRQTGFLPTDEEGKFRLTEIATPSKFFVELENFSTGSSVTPAVPVELRDNVEIPGVEFHVRLTGTISGKVLNDAEEPLRGIKVVAFRCEYQRSFSNEYTNGEPWCSPWGPVRTTNDRGEYTIADLQAGYHFRILAVPSLGNVPPLSDMPRDLNSRRQINAATYYPRTGRYDQSEPILLRSLENRAGVDVHMRSLDSRCVEATLKANGNPAKMRFLIVDDQVRTALLPLSQPFSGFTGIGGETESDGKLRVCGLYTGSFKILAYTPFPPVSVLPGFVAALSFSITETDLVDLVINAVPPITLRGEVVTDGFEVEQSQSLGISIAPGPLGVMRSIPITGGFSFAAAVGVRSTIAVQLKDPYFVKDIIYDRVSILNGTFVPAMGTDTLRIIIGKGLGSLSVQLRDSNRRVRNSVLVLPAYPLSEAEMSNRLIAGYADDQGKFVARGIQPGKYLVLAMEIPPPSRTLQPSAQLAIFTTPEIIRALMQIRTTGQPVDVQANSEIQLNVVPQPFIMH